MKSKDNCRESLQNFLRLAEDFDVSVTETCSASPISVQQPECHASNNSCSEEPNEAQEKASLVNKNDQVWLYPVSNCFYYLLFSIASQSLLVHL